MTQRKGNPSDLDMWIDSTLRLHTVTEILIPYIVYGTNTVGRSSFKRLAIDISFHMNDLIA